MKNPNPIKTRRAQLIADAQSILDKAQAENRALAAEERITLDNTQAAARELNDEIERTEYRNNLEMSTAGGTTRADLTSETRAFLNFIRRGVKGLESHEQRALVEDVTGQYLVSPEIEATIERTVAKLCPIRQLASKRTVTKDRMLVRGLSDASVSWGKLETGAAISETDLTPDERTVYIQDMSGLIKIGKDELADSDADLLAFITDSFSRAIAEREELGFLAGLGNGYGEPDGVITDTTLLANTLTTTAANAISMEDLMSMIYQVPARYRQGSAWLVSSVTELYIRQLRSGAYTAIDGPFLWTPSLIAGQPNQLLGYPVLTDDNLGTLAGTQEVLVVFGNWQLGYQILDRKLIAIQRLDELYAEAGLVGFIVHYRVGGYPIRPANKSLVLLREHA